MSDYSIAEQYTLPSKGRVYSVPVNPVVKLRSMTTQEEMKRLAPSDRAYMNICEIIDDCLVEKPAISAYDMCLADYQYLLHKLRVVTYGPEYNITSRCPYCGSDTDSVVNLDELPVTPYTDNFSQLSSFELPKTKKKVTLRMQTPRIVDDINAQAKELKKKAKGSVGDAAFLFSIQALIDTVDGEKIDPIKKESFVRNLPMMDTNFIVTKANKLSESFGIDAKVKNTCSVCGLDYTSPFRITTEFFRPRIDE